MTPGGGPPAAPGAGPATPRGVPIGADLSRWTYWWRANRDRFIRLRDSLGQSYTVTGSDEFYMGASRRVPSVDLTRPTDADTENRILPALKRMLDQTDQRDINETTMVALGKIGREHPNFSTVSLMRERVSAPTYGVRQTATIAMGISQLPTALKDLRHLVLDDTEGRRMMKRTFVDNRTRSFAAYGMGLIAWAGDAASKRDTVATMANILRSEEIVDRNLRVAAIHALGILNPNPNDASKPNGVHALALAELDRFYNKKLGRGGAIMQSHVPTAVAKLLGRGTTARHERYKKLYRRQLTGNEKQSHQIYRAIAIALGQLASPGETKKKDAQYSKALLHYFENGRDQQARYLCLVSLGQIGGNANRNALLSVLSRGKKALERPWAALALGVYCHRSVDRDPHAVVDGTIGRALVAQFDAVRTPETRAAVAIALGLARFADAAPRLMATLRDKEHHDEFAGYLCMGLALMGHQKAKPLIHAVCQRAVRRPELLKRAAIALGKLGDQRVSATLIEMLAHESANLASLSAISVALGHIGDRRSIRPLVAMLADNAASDLSRAFAAAALGGIADKEPLPWNAKIAANSNYRAAVETLADIL